MSAKFKRRLRRIATALVGLYALVLTLIFATHLPDRLIIHAAPGALPCPGGQSMLVPSPTGQLEICTARSPAATAAAPQLFVLYFVGNEDRVNLWTAGVANMWEQNTGRAIEAWGVNLPGFGLSTGPAYLSRIGPAALAAYDRLKSVAEARPIAVQAGSLGTLSALCIAAHRPVAALTLQDPPPLSALVLKRNSWWNAYLLSIPIALSLPGDIDSVANAAHTMAPCVFITSECDTVVPPEFQQQIFDAYAGAKHQVILSGGRHCAQPNDSEALKLGELRRQLFAAKP